MNALKIIIFLVSITLTGIEFTHTEWNDAKKFNYNIAKVALASILSVTTGVLMICEIRKDRKDKRRNSSLDLFTRFSQLKVGNTGEVNDFVMGVGSHPIYYELLAQKMSADEISQLVKENYIEENDKIKILKIKYSKKVSKKLEP